MRVCPGRWQGVGKETGGGGRGGAGPVEVIRLSRMHSCLCSLSFKFNFKADSISNKICSEECVGVMRVFMFCSWGPQPPLLLSFWFFFSFFVGQGSFSIAKLDSTLRAFTIHTRSSSRSGNSNGEKTGKLQENPSRFSCSSWFPASSRLPLLPPARPAGRRSVTLLLTGLL